MPAKAPKLPDAGATSISVAEAFGLPQDWKTDTEAPESEPTPTVEPAAEPTPPAEEPVAPAEGEAEPAVEPTPAEESKPAAEPSAKPATAAPAGKADAGKGKPAAADKTKTPAAEKPKEPTPVVPPAVQKIKLGDKEYTEAELQALIAPKPQPAKPAEPAKVTEEKVRTPEEIAAERAELKKKDTEWVAATAQHVDVNLDEKSVDTILAGGPEAVAAMVALLKNNAAQAVLMARKSLLNDLDPVLKGIRDVQQPMIERYHREESDRAWSDFSKVNPDLTDYRDIVETIGKAMVDSNSPALAEVKSMEDFGRVVGEEARRYIARFNKAQQQPPATTPAPVVEAPPAAAPAPVRAKVKAPVSNIPAPAATAAKRTRVDVSSLLPP